MKTEQFRLISGYDRQLQLHNSPRSPSLCEAFIFPPGDIPEKVPDKNVIYHRSLRTREGVIRSALLGNIHHRISDSEGSRHS